MRIIPHFLNLILHSLTEQATICLWFSNGAMLHQTKAYHPTTHAWIVSSSEFPVPHMSRENTASPSISSMEPEAHVSQNYTNKK
jgi:hypothetical protein